MNLSIVSAKYVAPLKVELHFNDDTIKTMLLHFMPKLHLPPLLAEVRFVASLPEPIYTAFSS